ncbi:hypothetical protein PV327_009479 [Microctonus hyperodae]|uniref:Cation-transporting ATPase n=1 Tax=Microctonus hyperodae TaxID=165561 RepID=A0AA39KW08_MICHY|nr:hypothetical protein PV327_009479 [Microctonus hyperodae]
MPATPKKLNLSFARNAYNAFSSRNQMNNIENQMEQKTELLEGARGNGLFHLKNGVDYINPGDEDQMEIYGYRRNKIYTSITWFFIIITGGLLRLIFHWFPQLMLKATHSICSLNEADRVLLIERFQGKHACYHVKKLQTMTAKDVCNGAADEDEPWSETVSLDHNNLESIAVDNEIPKKLSVHLHGGNFKQLSSILTFSCKKLRYVWDAERSEFMKLIGLDIGVLTSTLHQMPGLSSQEQLFRRCVYGNNRIVIPVKSFITLLGLEVLNPFYVFQIFSFCLWIADDYYYYAIVILLMSSFGIGLAVFQTRKNQLKLRSTIQSSDVATVMRDRTTGKIESVPAERLVPGDILVIPPHGCLMPCDAVLLTGNCILNESMLTGESVPVTKTPLPSNNEIIYDIKEHARHTLFCGTKIIQTRYFGGEKVLAIVVRTGFYTSKGGLVRSIMYPPPVDFKFEQDSYKFVILLAFIASIGVIYTIVTKVIRNVTIGRITLEALDLITVVVPPALPAAMTVGRLVAQSRLEKKRIYCTSPRAINVSGSIDCICFDKTGTLTEDGLDMWGVVSVAEGKFQVYTKDIKTLPASNILFGMVTCHGITIIDNQLVGDPLDLKMFESTGWSLEEPDVSDNSKFSMMFPTIVRPSKNSKLLQTPHHELISMGISPARQSSILSEVENLSLNNIATSDAELAEQGLEIGIIRQFTFTSSLQRMSVITRTLGASSYDLYCKGSPEMISSLSKPDSVPSNFASILEEYTSEGYRVIALGHKTLNRLTYAKVQRISRDVAESELTFLGFVILENRLKPETTPVIEALNRAQIKTVMVTGDNILTALSVARDCDMLNPEIPVILVTASMQQNQLKPHLYFSRNNGPQSPMSPNGHNSIISEMTDLNSITSLEINESGSFDKNIPNNGINYLSDDVRTMNRYVFALTGKTWAIIKHHYPELLPQITTRGAIFARMSPDDKQQLVQELQSLGYYVAMVGDGANDCGALKAAHTGISLSDTESSVASPFTSRETNISCVLSVIREGRAALVTSFGIFKYMAAYSLTQFISVMLLYDIESNLTDIEFLYIDLFIISIFAFFFGRTHAYDGPLVKTPPLTSLLSLSPILSLFLQMIIITIFQSLSLWHLRTNEWFEPFNISATEDSENDGCLENYTIFIVSTLQYITLAIVFSKGHPYRKSIFTNYGLLASSILMTLFSVYLAVWPSSWLIYEFELELPSDMNFRIILIGYGAINFIVSFLVEYFLVEYLVFRKLRYRWHNIDKSKKKFLAIDRDMSKNFKWPPLTHEPLPEVAPDILLRRNTITEIKIEKHVSNDSTQHNNHTNVDASFLNSPSSLGFKRFGSAREVTLNPRGLFKDHRNTVSMQTVPIANEERELNDIKDSNDANVTLKRRHNSESENNIDNCDKPQRLRQINPIATLPRNPVATQYNQKLKDMMRINKSEGGLRVDAVSVLELDVMPS